jgi:alkylated DNA repair dioxygenase AlkB
MNESTIVKGLFHGNNVLTNEKSQNIISCLDKRGWTPIGSTDDEKITEIKKGKRRIVQQFGYYYDYNDGSVLQKAPDFPDFIKDLADILTQKCKELNLTDNNYVFNQCIVNNYFPGEGISSHTDSPKFGKVIGCFTLGSGSLMRFMNKTSNINNEYELYTENRSLYIMSSDARYTWLHQMEQNKSDVVDGMKIPRGRRISITFRYVPN